MRKLLGIALLFVLSDPLQATTCYYTLVKGSCWKDYSVTVAIKDSESNKQLLTLTVPEEKLWGRGTFECQPSETLLFSATFSPLIWEQYKDKSYTSVRDWLLPSAVEKSDTDWSITMCFPKDFSEVPDPPSNNGECACAFDQVSPIEGPNK